MVTAEYTQPSLAVMAMLDICRNIRAALDLWVDKNKHLLNEYNAREADLNREYRMWTEELKMIFESGPSITAPTQSEIDLLTNSVKQLSQRVQASNAGNELLNVFADLIRQVAPVPAPVRATA